MKCKICQSSSDEFAIATILNRHNIQYYQCSNCGFVQTEEPYWLADAYQQAIAQSDVGLVYRNNLTSRLTQIAISNLFNGDQSFLDFGGGYGLFVRMMRDLGYDFYWRDKYCQNLFARGFEDFPEINKKYELVTAFEVFEHFVNPLDEIAEVLTFSPNVFLSTTLLPDHSPKPGDWWYYALEEGQHIALYTFESLNIIAQKFNLFLCSDHNSWHLLTEKPLSQNIFENLDYLQQQLKQRPSLIQQDYFKITQRTNYADVGIDFDQAPSNEASPPISPHYPLRIAVDGVFFQLYKTGIARLWKSLLTAWVENGFAEYILVLDRAGTMPKIEGIPYLEITAFDYENIDTDRNLLDTICDQYQITLFISSYYTFPSHIPSVTLIYDMIPEVGRWNLSEPMWAEKHQAIAKASAHITISQNTANDLIAFFPQVLSDSVTVAPCGIEEHFRPATEDAIASFKYKYGINKPYFLLVGIGAGYKNTKLVLQAFSQLPNRQSFDLICTGNTANFEPEWREYTQGSTVHLFYLSDEELVTAYSGAIALVFPSQYEGFGLPILEAMSCGCPVITCPNGSIPEVAGDAALYVNSDDADGLAQALSEIQKLNIRQRLVAAGLEQSKGFSWQVMAQKISQVLIKTSLDFIDLRAVNLMILPDWSADEELLAAEMQQLIQVVNTHPDCANLTIIVEVQDMDLDNINVWLSELALNLMLETDTEINEAISIIPVGLLVSIQWEYLLSQVQAKIDLSHENLSPLQDHPHFTPKSISVEDLKHQRVIQISSEKWDLGVVSIPFG